jgi:hypothetical protein
MEQSDLLVFLCRHLEQTKIRYFITGSHATIVFGEPRFTNDIDVVVDLNETNCDDFCDGFPESEFYLNRQTAHQECQRQGMFNIIHPGSGLKIDVIVAKDDSRERSRMERSVKIPIADDCEGIFSSPEDMIVQKLKWHQMGGGERHLRDIAGILKIRDNTLDVSYISQQVTELGLEKLWQQFAESNS